MRPIIRFRKRTQTFLMLIPMLILSCDDRDSTTEMSSGDLLNAGSETMAGTASNAGVETSMIEEPNAGNDSTAGAEGVGGVSNAGTESTAGLSSTEPIMSCEEMNSNRCFANADCQENARCQNLGTEEIPVPCCVQGERGTLAVGEVCNPTDGQLTCASSLCIAHEETGNNAYCSGECLSDSDCPESMPRCISIAFSGSDKLWCFPPSSSK